MVTICQDEMYKLREHGGAKLSNIHAKSEASKIQWLIELCSNPNLATHLALVNELLGEQKGGIQGTDIFFTNKHYARRILKISSPYYLEAISAMAALETRKQILNPRDEKVFYNPVFTQENDQIIRLNNYCEREGVFTYGQLLDEVTLRDNGRPYRAPITKVHDRIIIRDLTNRQEPAW